MCNFDCESLWFLLGWWTDRKLQTVLGQILLSVLFLLCYYKCLLMTSQPICQLSHRVAAVWQSILFLQGHLGKWSIVSVGYKYTIPWKSPSGDRWDNFSVTFPCEQYRVCMWSRTERQGTHGCSRFVGISRQNVVESYSGFVELRVNYELEVGCLTNIVKARTGWWFL